jgi:hypothetical protein
MLAGNLSASWDNGHVNGNPANSIQDNDGDTFEFSPNITWVAGDGSGYAAFAEDCDDCEGELTHPCQFEGLNKPILAD